MYFKQRF